MIPIIFLAFALHTFLRFLQRRRAASSRYATDPPLSFISTPQEEVYCKVLELAALSGDICTREFAPTSAEVLSSHKLIHKCVARYFELRALGRLGDAQALIDVQGGKALLRAARVILRGTSDAKLALVWDAYRFQHLSVPREVAPEGLVGGLAPDEDAARDLRALLLALMEALEVSIWQLDVGHAQRSPQLQSHEAVAITHAFFSNEEADVVPVTSGYKGADITAASLLLLATIIVVFPDVEEKF